MQTLINLYMSNYIYVYVDISKPGFYQYTTSMGTFTFDHMPVYIGKGMYDRINSHIESAKNNRLKELIDTGDFDCYKISEDLSSHLAYKLEAELIYKIGRLDLDKGPLFNESAGIRLIEANKFDNIGPLHIEFNKIINIIKALNSTKTLKEAANLLEISERTLHRYKKSYRLQREQSGDWIQSM